MPNITIKGIPEDTYNLLKQRAKLNRRSLNSEIILTLEQSAERRREKVESIIRELDEFYSKIKVTPLTDDDLKRAKEYGRS